MPDLLWQREGWRVGDNLTWEVSNDGHRVFVVNLSWRDAKEELIFHSLLSRRAHDRLNEPSVAEIPLSRLQMSEASISSFRSSQSPMPISGTQRLSNKS